MENLIASLKQLDSWLNNQSWITYSLNFLRSLIGFDQKVAQTACLYALSIAIVSAPLTLIVDHGPAAAISVLAIMILSIITMLRVVDGVVSMANSSVFMSILDLTKLFFLLMVATDLVTVVICIFDRHAIAMASFLALSNFSFLMALLFGKTAVTSYLKEGIKM